MYVTFLHEKGIFLTPPSIQITAVTLFSFQSIHAGRKIFISFPIIISDSETPAGLEFTPAMLFSLHGIMHNTLGRE